MSDSILSVTDTTHVRNFPFNINLYRYITPPRSHTQVITELIFNGVFNDLDPAQTAALLSALIFTEKCDEGTLNTLNMHIYR